MIRDSRERAREHDVFPGSAPLASGKRESIGTALNRARSSFDFPSHSDIHTHHTYIHTNPVCNVLFSGFFSLARSRLSVSSIPHTAFFPPYVCACVCVCIHTDIPVGRVKLKTRETRAVLSARWFSPSLSPAMISHTETSDCAPAPVYMRVYKPPTRIPLLRICIRALMKQAIDKWHIVLLLLLLHTTTRPRARSRFPLDITQTHAP